MTKPEGVRPLRLGALDPQRGLTPSEHPPRLGRQVRMNLVRDLKEALSGAETVLVAKMERVPTRRLNHLRHSLKSLDSDLLVVKNALCRLVFRERGWLPLEKAVEGTCGVSPVRGDAAETCKLLASFSKEHEGFVLQGGVLSGQVLGSKDVVALGKLPPRAVLLSQLAGVVQMPVRNLAFLLQAPLRSLVLTLEGIRQKKEKQ